MLSPYLLNCLPLYALVRQQYRLQDARSMMEASATPVFFWRTAGGVAMTYWLYLPLRL